MSDTQGRPDSEPRPPWLASGRQRIVGRAHLPCGVFAIVVIAAAIALSACGGGAPDSPQVANLGTSSTTTSRDAANTTTAPRGGNATHLMDEWAACMRTNGDPNQTDPTIDQYGVINITMPDGISQELSAEAHGTAGPCSQYELDGRRTSCGPPTRLRRRRPRANWRSTTTACGPMVFPTTRARDPMGRATSGPPA